MIDREIIIDDQKETIHRLQQECTEKTNTIIALGEQLQRKTQECEELKEQLAYLTEYRKQNQTCQECYEDGYNVGKYENKELNRYRKALKEIEGIVIKDHYDDNWADIAIKIDSIRNIINKVKGDN